MNNLKLVKILEETGLTENESKIYLSALSLGPTTALKLARVTDIKRPTVYVIIESLKSKGLMTIEINGFKKLFVAENPEKLESVLETKANLFKKNLSQFSALYKLKESNGAMKYYEGLEAVKNVYEQLLKDVNAGDYYYVLSDARQWLSLDREYFMDFTERRGKLPINIKLLMQESEEARYLQKFQNNFNYQAKILSKDTKLTTALIITPQKVVINQLVAPINAIVIENQNIINMNKEMFEAMWKKEDL